MQSCLWQSAGAWSSHIMTHIRKAANSPICVDRETLAAFLVSSALQNTLLREWVDACRL